MFSLLKLLFEDIPDFKEYVQLEMKKNAAHCYKGNASKIEQCENKLGAEYQKFKYNLLSWKPEIPKNIAMYDQEEKNTKSSKRKTDF